jgi:chromatin modification-related protein VID21
MRTDFREERKWKHAVAYQLSTSVLEWHALGSWDERVEHGVCVKWKPMQEDEGAVERGEGEEVDMDTDLDNLDADGTTEPQDSGRSSRLAVDHASDDEDEDMENDEAPDTKDVVNPLSTAEDLEGAMDEEATARELEKAQAEIREADEKHLKKEDMDDASALRDNDAAVKDRTQGRGAEPEIAGLKSTSKDPMLGSKSSSHSLNGDAEDSKSNSAKARISAYAPMREKIVYSSSDKLFIGPDDVEGFVHSGNPDNADYGVLHALGLGTLFPELQPFGMLDVAPPVVPEPGAKKRSSRSADKDDPNKRVEETNYTKVMPAGRFMTVKPTLLGPLQPAKNYKDGKWLPMEEYAIAPDVDSTGRITEESLCGGFSLMK